MDKRKPKKLGPSDREDNNRCLYLRSKCNWTLPEAKRRPKRFDRGVASERKSLHEYLQIAMSGR